VSIPDVFPLHLCQSSDLFEEVNERSEAVALLRGYRNDPAAMNRLRAVLSVTTMDVFRQDDNDVLDAAAGQILRGELRVRRDPCERKSEENRFYLDWILAYRNDAQQASVDLRTSVQNILALAAVESDFGRNRWAREANNFYALSTRRDQKLPYQIGFVVALGDPKIGMAKYEDFFHCTKSFAETKGQLIKGHVDPHRFATILHTQGNMGNGPEGPIMGYVAEVMRVIRELELRLDCV